MLKGINPKVDPCGAPRVPVRIQYPDIKLVINFRVLSLKPKFFTVLIKYYDLQYQRCQISKEIGSVAARARCISDR